MVRAEVRDGQVGLVLPKVKEWPLEEWLTLDQVNKTLNTRPAPALPQGWSRLQGESRLFAIGGLDPNQLHDLVATLLALEPRLVENKPELGGLSFRFKTLVAGADERLKGLLDWQLLVARAEEKCLLKVKRFAQIALRILRDFRMKDSSDRSIHIIFAHNDGGIAAELITQAKNGLLNRQHLLIMTCNDDANPEVYRKLAEARDTALAHGALSVLVSDRGINLPAATLAVLALNKRWGIWGVVTPRQLLLKGYGIARQQLLECSKAKDPIEAIRSEFGEDALQFFLKDEHIDDAEIENTLKRLESDCRSILEFVDAERRSCWNRQSRLAS